MYSDEELDKVLNNMHVCAEHTKLYSINSRNVKMMGIITILCRSGYAEHVKGGFGDEALFRLTPTGMEFIRNGGFKGEKEAKLQTMQDREETRNYRRWDLGLKWGQIIVSFLSGAVAGTLIAHFFLK